jgi:cytochrome c553
MKSKNQSLTAAVAASLMLSLCSLSALADGDRRASPTPLLPSYQAECGACHLAYPPGLLPAASWQRLLQNLPRHFGTDASLEPAQRAELQPWLMAAAGTGQRRRAEATAPPDDRITRSAWFIREHDEIAAATWKRPSVKSAANCAACHGGANQGSFDEHDIRIPR